ncbi:unnamed protein product [Caenorhabditis bovis]|uniref:Calmodulin-lysine N-methyltransferase n=1 Tax=Caenorhabditis bovis TaxID=2654633 RepID=A0A8S1FDA7_9PELO|nr:unnamed protein product [Caenorhabditis bovis]
MNEDEARDIGNALNAVSSKRHASDEADFINDARSSKRARQNWSLFASRVRRVVKGSPPEIGRDLVFFDVIDGQIAGTKNLKWKANRNLDVVMFNDRKNQPTLDEIAKGFDRTGNVRIWGGSEALGHAILKRAIDLSETNDVLELGAGFLAIPSFCFTATFPDAKIFISDGSDEALKNLEEVKKLNNNTNIEIGKVLWGETKLDRKFDVILAAECVFFADHHENFMRCVDEHLKPDGVVVIASPLRKNSLERFFDHVRDHWKEFDIEFEKDINEQMAQQYYETRSDPDEDELNAAVEFGVLKMADEVGEDIATRNAIDHLRFEPDVIRRISALVFDTVVEDWATDLVAFASHAGRQNVNLDDIALLTRRNPELFEMACKMAGVRPSDEKEKGKKAKSRKRKVESAQVSPFNVDDANTRSRSNSINRASPVPISIEAPNLSFLKTPAIKPVTSTPKSTPNPTFTARGRLFSDDITPIRPNEHNQKADLINLTKIDEEDEIQEIVEPDSFENFFAKREMPTTSTLNGNLSSLIRDAEKVGDEQRNLENERLEAMVPDDYDSFDDEIIVDSVIRPNEKPSSSMSTAKQRTNSPDPFGNSTGSNQSSTLTEQKNQQTPAPAKRNSVFSTKFSAFSFDDDDDSFDAPIQQPAEKLKDEPASQDSFDFPIQTTSNSQSSIPKWKMVADKYAAKTPKQKKKSPSPVATESAKKRSRLNIEDDRDSFDEFDFGV